MYVSSFAVADLLPRVSERAARSVTVRFFATTSRASRSPPSAVLLVEVV